MIYLRLYQNYTISRLFNKKLSNQQIDFFKIIEIVDKFKQIWRLKLSFVMKIHSIVLITQLKSIILNQNFYNKSTNQDFSSIEKNQSRIEISHYEIERLLNKRLTRDHANYLVKWKKYDYEHNVWYFLHILNNVDEFVVEYETRIVNMKSKNKSENIVDDINVKRKNDKRNKSKNKFRFF